jgi:hypothetical protein
MPLRTVRSFTSFLPVINNTFEGIRFDCCHSYGISDCISGKGKVVPVLNYLSTRHEGVLGSGCIDPQFLDLGTSWR